jgi:hypothetical protein
MAALGDVPAGRPSGLVGGQLFTRRDGHNEQGSLTIAMKFAPRSMHFSGLPDPSTGRPWKIRSLLNSFIKTDDAAIVADSARERFGTLCSGVYVSRRIVANDAAKYPSLVTS